MGRPLIWITLAFATGILAGEHHRAAPAVLLGFTTCLYVAWLALLAFGRSPRAALAAFALALALFASLGHFASVFDPAHRQVVAAGPWLGKRVDIEALVVGPPLARGPRVRARLRVLRLDAGPLPTPFTVLASLPATPGLAFGDVIAIRGRLEPPPEAGNPGEPSVRAALRRQGVVALLRGTGHGGVVVRRRGAGNRVVRWAFAARDRMAAPFLSLPAPYGGVLAGLLLGAETGVDEGMQDLFLRAGLLHTLVVSGTQVSLVAGAALALTRALRGRELIRSAIAAAVVVLFSTMTGWSASVGRAALMALTGLAAVAVRRDPDPATTLALAALLWLAIYPGALFSLGFQLSFAATWGILFLTPALTPTRGPRWLAQLIGASCGAQIGVLPLLAAVFQRVSLAAFPANLLVLPLVALIVPAGFALAAVALALPAVSAFLAPAFLPAVWAIVALARLFAAAPGAQVWLPPVAWWQAAAAYGALACLPRLRHTGVPRLLTGYAAGMVLIFSLADLAPDGLNLAAPHLLVAALDVGQGDALFIRAPERRTLLIDAGGEVVVGGRAIHVDDPGSGIEARDATARASARPPGRRRDIGGERVVPALRRLGVRRLDVVVLSHADEDHAGGLPAVLENFSVGLVIDPGVPHTSPSYLHLLQLVRRRRIPYALGRRGQRLALGEGVSTHILAPIGEMDDATDPEDAVNGRSIVIRLLYGRIGFLLTGDIEAETEAELLATGDPLESTVLKVAHHGSKTSTTPAFVGAVRPAMAVISAGAGNFFGHPHPQTLRTLQAHGVRIFRTDRHGAVLMRTDGRALAVETMRP